MKKQLFMILAFFGSFIIQGQIINIPGNYSTIQEGIEAANEGDTVLVEIGTYYENLDFEGKNITLASTFILSGDESIIEETVIDGGQNGSVISFVNGEDSSTCLIGFMVTNGLAFDGGGILITSSNDIRGPNLQNLIIWNNKAIGYLGVGRGGGVFCNNVNIELTDVKIETNNAGIGGGAYFKNSNSSMQDTWVTNNSGTESGGGIHCVNSILNITTVQIRYNVGGDGAGIYCDDSFLELSEVLINNNHGINGGGICLLNSEFEYTDLTIKHNIASNGAGIYMSSDEGSSKLFSDFTLSDNYGYNGSAIYSQNVSLFLDGFNCSNNQSDFGAAICAIGCNDVKITNSNFTYNVGAYGGCLYVKDCGNVKVENSGFSHAPDNTLGFLYAESSNIELKGVVMTNSHLNSEWGSGAGIYGKDLDLKIINCTFADISAYYHGEVISLEGTSNCEIVNCVFDSLCSERILVAPYDEYSGDYLTASVSHSNLHPDQVWANELDWQSGNIYKDPEFVLVGPHPYQIIESSPCADAGTNDTTGLSLPEFDCANNPRINNQRVDMGAYEWDITVSDNEITIDKKNINTELLVFPNPFKNKFIVEFEMEKHGDATMTLYDIKGVMIKQNLLLGLSKGKQTEEFYLPNLVSGVYTIKINFQNKVLSHKILKTE